MEIHSPDIPATLGPVAELDRLGDEIAELSAHLDAATARLLDLIREFDARGGWNSPLNSSRRARACAALRTNSKEDRPVFSKRLRDAVEMPERFAKVSRVQPLFNLRARMRSDSASPVSMGPSSVRSVARMSYYT